MTLPMTTNFNMDDVKCPCGCGRAIVDRNLLRRLQAARIIADIPFNISSWCRCEKHNKDKGGMENSDHLHNVAVDIYCPDPVDRWITVRALMDAGFNVIRIYEKHIHAAVSKKTEYCLLSIGKY